MADIVVINDANNNIEVVTVAEGAPGRKGDQGTQGDIGLTGGIGLTGDVGEQGIQGAEGLSAYQIWVNLGNIGTEAEYLIAIKGEQGTQGTIGNTGLTGEKGLTGDIGLTGETGLQGIPGQDGLGIGDMIKATYDSNADGIVNDSDKLGGVVASGYATSAQGIKADVAATQIFVDSHLADIVTQPAPNKIPRAGVDGKINAMWLPDTYNTFGIRHINSTDTITRIGGAVGKVANIYPGINNLDNIMPWAGMRRCNLADNLNVNAYYGDASYIENGSNGQVMVEVPAFYYSRIQIDADTVDTYISMLPLAGFKLHPWFYDVNGFPVNKKYISAYEGSIYDVSALAYLLTDQQVADFTVTTGDKLSSIANAKPCSGLTQDLTLPKSRILATNRGTGWQQQYFNAVSAIQMLIQVEYASLKSQATIGQGVVNKTDDGSTNMSVITGATSFLGNKSGRATGTDGLVSISYRGIENFWGNIWKWVDGINIQNRVKKEEIDS